ncbi:MAG: GTPase HflX [Bauldia sp.]
MSASGQGPSGPSETAAKPQKALVLVPLLRRRQAAGSAPSRAVEGKVAEAKALAEAIDLDVVGAQSVPLAAFHPGTLFGSGKVEEIARQVELTGSGLVVIDHAVSPIQQRNLEKAWKTKVIDRTGLILEIFGERAQTREGRLQVELAHLTYQRGRLVRSWTHLERQRGGFGFLGGPGETQIEADRRLIQERIDRIEKELDSVVRTRRLQRANRRRSDLPVVALVGYTNAGKTTLFNALTRSAQFAKDQLFATLDPAMRRLRLPQGVEIVLSDTVGFVADLPTDLVAAFRATLEEVVEADLVLHVRDIAHPETTVQAADVANVLGQLGVAADKVLEVWNKADLLREAAPAAAISGAGGPISISALRGEGLDALLVAIERRLTEAHSIFEVRLAPDEVAAAHRLYDFGEVLDRREGPDGLVAIVRIAPRHLAPFQQQFPNAERRAN